MRCEGERNRLLKRVVIIDKFLPGDEWNQVNRRDNPDVLLGSVLSAHPVLLWPPISPVQIEFDQK